MTDPTATPPAPATVAPVVDTSAVLPPADAASATAAAAPAGNPAAEKLASLGVDSAIVAALVADGFDSLESLPAIDEAALKTAGMTKRGQILTLLKKLADLNQAPSPAPVAAAMASAQPLVQLVSHLPVVPTSDSWLAALRTTGVLKVDTTTVVAAVKAALAKRVGMFDILSLVVSRMEAYADACQEPVGEAFLEALDELTTNRYAHILGNIKGFNARRYASEARKNELYRRMDDIFWPAIASFNRQLGAWYDLWIKQSSNPAMFNNALARLAGAAGTAAPAMQAPSPAVLRDSADGVIDAINKVFAGTGAMTTAAIACDATKVKQMLVRQDLPLLLGYTNREIMLRELKIDVPPTYERLEHDLSQFVLAVLESKNQPSGQTELDYFGSMYALGQEISWDLIKKGNARASGGNGPTGLGGRPIRSSVAPAGESDEDEADDGFPSRGRGRI